MISKVFILCLLLAQVFLLPEKASPSPVVTGNLVTNESSRPARIVVNIPSQYVLPATKSWTPYPMLNRQFILEKAQYLYVSCMITLSLKVPSIMGFRVVIDGVEQLMFRWQTQEAKRLIYYAAKDNVWLQAGTHKIEVYYKKSGKEQLIRDDGISVEILKLQYMQTGDRKEEKKINVLQQTGNRRAFVEPNYPFTLTTDNAWRSFPQLQLNFTLQEDQIVHIHYKTSVLYQSYDININSHFIVRVFIDGKEQNLLRSMGGISRWITNQSAKLLDLKAGKHNVRVQYRTPGAMYPQTPGDWVANFLEVRY